MVSNAKYFMPHLLANFHAAHPGVELKVIVGNREQLVRQLCNGEADLAVMGAPPGDVETQAEPLAPQPLGILASPDHPLALQHGIPVCALAPYEFIVREPGSGTRAAMDRLFRDAGIEPRRAMELNSNEIIKQSVIANMGLAFLSFHTAGLELKSRLLIALDVLGLPMIRHWYVVKLGGDPLNPAAESMRRFLVQFGGGLIARQFDGIDLGMFSARAAMS
jgi:DNA-binding transcriptional LysR family regulator